MSTAIIEMFKTEDVELKAMEISKSLLDSSKTNLFFKANDQGFASLNPEEKIKFSNVCDDIVYLMVYAKLARKGHYQTRVDNVLDMFAKSVSNHEIEKLIMENYRIVSDIVITFVELETSSHSPSKKSCEVVNKAMSAYREVSHKRFDS
ncbi:MAG: hypothetical protein GY909_16095 [Oligoflexia bacterium]|nr:hypothetical protein [Oligoflexia bacterium]